MTIQGKGTEQNKGKVAGDGLGTQDPMTIVRELYDCFNRRDWDRAMSMVARDAKYLNVPMNKTYSGHEQFKHSMTDWVDGFPDAKIEVKSMIVQGNQVVTEFIGRGTHSATFVGPQGPIPATNKRVELPFVEFVEVRNGQIVNTRMYFDTGMMMRQLGLMK